MICSECAKPSDLCVCPEAKYENETPILILQHPQEPSELLGSATIAKALLKNCKIRVGLSWPSLKAAWGEDVNQRKWGVLHLGARGTRGPKGTKGSRKEGPKGSDLFQVEETPLEGIVVLDGSWKQAKTLWWRNPWMLKLKRLSLSPKSASLYGSIRKEPRKECLSTLESIALCLDQLGEEDSIPKGLTRGFSHFLSRYKTLS